MHRELHVLWMQVEVTEHILLRTEQSRRFLGDTVCLDHAKVIIDALEATVVIDELVRCPDCLFLCELCHVCIITSGEGLSKVNDFLFCHIRLPLRGIKVATRQHPPADVVVSVILQCCYCFGEIHAEYMVTDIVTHTKREVNPGVCQEPLLGSLCLAATIFDGVA